MGCIPPTSVAISWGCLPRGVCPGGGCVPRGLSGTPNPLLWTEWLADRCKNITFPQLRLRVVTVLGVFFFLLNYCHIHTCVFRHLHRASTPGVTCCRQTLRPRTLRSSIYPGSCTSTRRPSSSTLHSIPAGKRTRRSPSSSCPSAKQTPRGAALGTTRQRE